MSLKIYKPKRFSGFEWLNKNTGSVSDPFENENLVAEIARYTGSTTQYYANTGECSFTVDIAAVTPDKIKSGYFVETDSGIYRIESVEWNQTDSGYTCTFGGRGIESFLDDAVYEYNTEAGYSYVGDEVESVKLGTISKLLTWMAFPTRHPLIWGNAILPTTRLLPIASKNGVLRFFARSYSNQIEHTTDAMTNGAGSTLITESGLSVGAILRTWLSWLGCGYRVRRYSYTPSSSYGETLYYYYQLVLYNQDPNKVITFIADSERGIKDFNYRYDSRDAVNQILYSFATYNRIEYIFNSDMPNHGIRYGEQETHRSEKLRTFAAFMRGSGAESVTEYSMLGASKYIDLGEVPDENDETAQDTLNWLNAQMSADNLTQPTEQVTFNYDNSGRYKYGVDFFLGSTVKVINDTLGITATQMLTKVTTNYVTGDAVSYGFEFGNQQVTQADKLKNKFSIIDKRTYK